MNSIPLKLTAAVVQHTKGKREKKKGGISFMVIAIFDVIVSSI